MMHKYTGKDLQQCVGERRLVFIGDSQVRQVFWIMAAKLDKKNAKYEFERVADKHTDQVFEGPDNLQLEFIWDPYLNSTRLSSEIMMASSENADPGGGNSSSLVVVGGGLWFAKNLGESSLQQFSQSVEAILHTLEAYDRTHTQLGSFPQRLPQSNHTRSLTMFLPAHKPLYVSLDSDHARTITPDRVESMHQKLLQASSQRRTPILWAYDKMTNQSETYQPDGLHLTENAVTAIADVILNVKCNSLLTATKGYPMAKTCCSRYPPLKKTQIVLVHATWLFPAIAWLLPMTISSITKFARGYTAIIDRSPDQLNKVAGHKPGLLRLMPTSKTSKAVFVILGATYYCWLADRTHLYNKAQKTLFSRRLPNTVFCDPADWHTLHPPIQNPQPTEIWWARCSHGRPFPIQRPNRRMERLDADHDSHLSLHWCKQSALDLQDRPPTRCFISVSDWLWTHHILPHERRFLFEASRRSAGPVEHAELYLAIRHAD